MEKYLEECIESAIKQSLNDIEIICINDGSTDSSLEILKKYEKKYSNIIVISQENKGLSASRNVGIRKAKGKYIYFLDSDDFIDTNSMELCYKECEKYNLDMVTFDAICFLDKDYVGNDINEDYDRRDLLPKYMLTGEEFYVVSNKSGGYKAPVWLNFYNTEFIRKNKLFFVEGIYHEDEIHTCHCLLKAKKIKYIDKFNISISKDECMKMFDYIKIMVTKRIDEDNQLDVLVVKRFFDLLKSKKIYFRTKIDILKQSACNLIRVLICCNYRAKLYEGCTTKKEIYETI